MHILALIESWPNSRGQSLAPLEVGEELSRAWSAHASAVNIDTFVVGDGGARTADALVGTRTQVGGADVVQVGDTLVLAAPRGHKRWEPHALATALLGIAADFAHGRPEGAPAQTVVIPVGDEPPAGDPTDVWLGGPEAMRAGVAALDLVVAVSSQRPLLGFNGMSAALRDGREHDPAIALAAQTQEDRWAEISRSGDAVANLRSLLGPTRLSDAPGTGAAGGLAYCLGVLGGRLQPAAALFATLAGAEQALAHTDLVVAVVPKLEPRSLDEGAIPAAGALAAQKGIPAIVIAPHASIGRRDLMNAGITSAHGGEPGLAGFTDTIRRVAQTWTRGG